MSNRPERVEIFNRDFKFIDMAMMNITKYEMDYISIGDTTVTVPKKIKASKGDYIVITSDTLSIQGIITSVEYDSNTAKIKHRPLINIMDIDVWCDVSLMDGMSIEERLKLLIKNQYVNNEDIQENIPGMEVTAGSSTTGTLGVETDVQNIYDIAVEMISLYRIAIYMELDLKNKKLLCNIRKATDTIRTIECNLKNVIDSSVVFKQAKVSYNKIVIIGEYKESDEQYGSYEKRIYYQDLEGNVTLTPKSRVLPVVSTTMTLSITDDFNEKAYEKAYKKIYNKQYDNYIEVKVKDGDRIVKQSDFEIGQQGRIIKDGVEYISIYTGYEINKTLTLYFGLIRKEYTKNIRNERSNKNVN